MKQDKVLEIIKSGEDTAYGLLYEADPKLIKRFNKLDKDLIKLLDDVTKHFPDARYYTASGGFNLLLGESHDDNECPQHDLIAVNGLARITDGDYLKQQPLSGLFITLPSMIKPLTLILTVPSPSLLLKYSLQPLPLPTVCELATVTKSTVTSPAPLSL